MDFMDFSTPISVLARSLRRVGSLMERSFALLDQITADVRDLYSKVNDSFRSDIDSLYISIQGCYDTCLMILEENGVDVDALRAVPLELRRAVKVGIEPQWKVFQHQIRRALTKYEKYTSKLDQELMEEIRGAASMTTEDLLNLFDKMLDEVNK